MIEEENVLMILVVQLIVWLIVMKIQDMSH